MTKQYDFELEDHGTVGLIRPLTDAAREWCEEHLPEDAQMFGTAYAVEPRYAMDIVQGFTGDGLTCEGMEALQ